MAVDLSAAEARNLEGVLSVEYDEKGWKKGWKKGEKGVFNRKRLLSCHFCSSFDITCEAVLLPRCQGAGVRAALWTGWFLAGRDTRKGIGRPASAGWRQNIWVNS